MIFFRLGSLVLILTCFLHLIGHFNSAPSTEAEKQVFYAMTSIPLDLGNGNTITMMQLQKGFSLCFSLLFLWSGVLSFVLSYKIGENINAIKTIAYINTGALAIGTSISLYYFFAAPTSCFVLAMILFAISCFRINPRT